MSLLSLNAEMSSKEERLTDYRSWVEMQGAREWRVSYLVVDHSRCFWCTSHIRLQTLYCEHLKLFTSSLSVPPLPTLCVQPIARHLEMAGSSAQEAVLDTTSFFASYEGRLNQTLHSVPGGPAGLGPSCPQ